MIFFLPWIIFIFLSYFSLSIFQMQFFRWRHYTKWKKRFSSIKKIFSSYFHSFLVLTMAENCYCTTRWVSSPIKCSTAYDLQPAITIKSERRKNTKKISIFHCRYDAGWKVFKVQNLREEKNKKNWQFSDTI